MSRYFVNHYAFNQAKQELYEVVKTLPPKEADRVDRLIGEIEFLQNRIDARMNKPKRKRA